MGQRLRPLTKSPVNGVTGPHLRRNSTSNQSKAITMLSILDFQFFDPKADFTITAGDLPHWQQAGATYFITYRTIDSISTVAMQRIIAERDDWLLRHGVNATASDWHVSLRKLPERQQQLFRRVFSTVFEKELDLLEGECLLKKPRLTQIVANSLRHFDGLRYQLAGFVVMPNHVHILVGSFPKFSMLQQCYGWKHFQAHQINLAENRIGHIFQPESFDHLVRDGDHFLKFRRYIEENPKKANLSDGDFELCLPDISWGSGSAR